MHPFFYRSDIVLINIIVDKRNGDKMTTKKGFFGHYYLILEVQKGK